MISDKVLEELQYELEGTCNSLQLIKEVHDLDISVDELEDRLLDGCAPIERCKSCRWWLRVGDLSENGQCYQCESYDGLDDGLDNE